LFFFVMLYLGVLPTAVLIYSHKSKYQEILERQLLRAEIPFIESVLAPFSWDGLILQQRQIARQNEDKLLVYLDAWDVVLIGDHKTLYEQRFENGIWISGEKNCWPDKARHEEYVKKQGERVGPWRYVNTGVIVGLGCKIADAMDWGLKNCPLQKSTNSILDPNGTDMKFWTDLYLNSPARINVDSNGELAYTMTGANRGELASINGKWTNTITWTMPIFAHANGGGTIPAVMLK